jgi:hypothetical protein
MATALPAELVDETRETLGEVVRLTLPADKWPAVVGWVDNVDAAVQAGDAENLADKLAVLQALVGNANADLTQNDEPGERDWMKFDALDFDELVLAAEPLDDDDDRLSFPRAVAGPMYARPAHRRLYVVVVAVVGLAVVLGVAFGVAGIRSWVVATGSWVAGRLDGAIGIGIGVGVGLGVAVVVVLFVVARITPRVVGNQRYPSRRSSNIGQSAGQYSAPIRSTAETASMPVPAPQELLEQVNRMVMSLDAAGGANDDPDH